MGRVAEAGVSTGRHVALKVVGATDLGAHGQRLRAGLRCRRREQSQGCHGQGSREVLDTLWQDVLLLSLGMERGSRPAILAIGPLFQKCREPPIPCSTVRFRTPPSTPGRSRSHPSRPNLNQIKNLPSGTPLALPVPRLRGNRTWTVSWMPEIDIAVWGAGRLW